MHSLINYLNLISNMIENKYLKNSDMDKSLSQNK